MAAPKKKTSHPHHWDSPKNINHRFFDVAVPLGLLLLFYVFYNKGVVSSHELAKTTGLLAISLLSATLIVGPLSRVSPFFEQFKANRKVWGVLSFWVAVTHMAIILKYYWGMDFSRFIDFNNSRYTTTWTGTLGIIILGLVTLTSTEKMIRSLSPSIWKIIQTTSYIALALVVYHFYFLTFKGEALAFRNGFSQVVFYFALLVIVARIAVMFLPSKKR